MTRLSMAKVRVEIDLLKPLMTSVWVGDEDENSPFKGFKQKIKHENVPKYCKQCKILENSILNCGVMETKRANEKREAKEKNNEDNNLSDQLGLKDQKKMQIPNQNNNIAEKTNQIVTQSTDKP